MTIQASRLDMDQAEHVPTSAMSEALLVRGYSRVTVDGAAIEPCACGDQIVAISRADVDVELAVRAHNRTTIHRAWRIRMGIPTSAERAA